MEWFRCIDFLRKQDVDVLSTLGEVFTKAIKNFDLYPLFGVVLPNVAGVKLSISVFCGVKQCAWDAPIFYKQFTKLYILVIIIP